MIFSSQPTGGVFYPESAILYMITISSALKSMNLWPSGPKMADLHVGAILVLNGAKLGGVFSERDHERVVLNAVIPRTSGRRSDDEVVTIDELAAVEEGMEAMQTHDCRHLPVARPHVGVSPCAT
jgi:CBS domain-containing protein